MKKSSSKAIRNANIISEVAKGRKLGDVGKEFGVCPNTMTKILNSQEAKEVIRKGNLKLAGMVDEALEVVTNTLRDTDNKVAFAAAAKVLVSVGVFRNNIDLAVQSAKPTVIHKPDGSSIVLGINDDDKDASKGEANEKEENKKKQER